MNTHDDDTDPTGMRALLRGLPDPGQMPDDLIDRIHASLAALPPLDGDEAADSYESAGVSRGTTSGTQAPWWVRHGSKAAIAAVVLIGGGVVATDSLGLLGSGSGSADTSAGADSSAVREESLSGDAYDGDQSAPTPAVPRTATSQSGQEASLGTVVVRHSGRDYTVAGLSTQLGTLQSAPTTSPLTAEAPGIGPIGTEIGVRSCLTALGLPRASAAEVDLGTLEGKPAAVLVVTVEGERTAYAVGRDCTTGHPAVLAGPVPLP